MNARVILPAPLDLLLRSELEKAIYEANLGEDDTLIADRYLIDHPEPPPRAYSSV